MAPQIVTCPECGARNRVPAVAKGVPQCPTCKSKLPWIATATDDDFAAVADSAKVTVLVDLWAPWCGPCRQLSPLLEKLAGERAGRLKVVKVNVDENPVTQAQFNATSIPTLVLFSGGCQVGVQRGALPLPALRQWVDAKA